MLLDSMRQNMSHDKTRPCVALRVRCRHDREGSYHPIHEVSSGPKAPFETTILASQQFLLSVDANMPRWCVPVHRDVGSTASIAGYPLAVERAPFRHIRPAQCNHR